MANGTIDCGSNAMVIERGGKYGKFAVCVAGENSGFETFKQAREFALYRGADPAYLAPETEDGYDWTEENELPEIAQKPYCKPWNAGLASETGSVCKRIGRLIDSLGDEINSNICEGEIVNDIWKFRTDLLTKLRGAGWNVEFVGDKTRVKAPK